MFTDPTGMKGESTRVKQESNGTYTVVGGDIKDGDNGIYIDNNGENGEKIGYSATPYSFFNTDKNKFMGTINPKDKSGKKFLNSLLAENPNEIGYGLNATRAKKYDFKRTNGTSEMIYDTPEDFFRGMPILDETDGLPIYASGRDVGNIGAGLVSGRNGLGWDATRVAFDALESYQKRTFTTETSGSVYAQRLGWNIGTAIYQKLETSRTPSNGHLRSIQIPKSYLGKNFKQRM